MANEPSTSQPHETIFSEEEIFDVSLSTFYVFDRENGPTAAWAPPQSTRKGGGTCISC